jgi:hypothetical protein
MKRSLQVVSTFIILLSAFITLFPKEAHAYVDPGTGSYFLQIVVGVLLGGLFSVKLFWKNVKNSFSRKKSKSKTSESE